VSQHLQSAIYAVMGSGLPADALRDQRLRGREAGQIGGAPRLVVVIQISLTRTLWAAVIATPGLTPNEDRYRVPNPI
jgi:hypothetical protein